jgi:hypothetical protein
MNLVWACALLSVGYVGARVLNWTSVIDREPITPCSHISRYECRKAPVPMPITAISTYCMHEK